MAKGEDWLILLIFTLIVMPAFWLLLKIVDYPKNAAEFERREVCLKKCTNQREQNKNGEEN